MIDVADDDRAACPQCGERSVAARVACSCPFCGFCWRPPEVEPWDDGEDGPSSAGGGM
jgi:hypothetical protein